MRNNRNSKLKAIIIIFLVAIVFIIGSVTYLVFWNNAPNVAKANH